MSAADTRVDANAGGLGRLLGAAEARLAWLGMLAAPLFLRVAVAIPFFRSGLTKWDGLSLSPSAIYLFENEFKLHFLGAVHDFPLPVAAAFASATGEIVLPILLVIGLATRFAALGIILMTLVIQLVVPGGWLTYHLPWGAMALALMALGPGVLSLDRLIARRIAG
jgi:putative oxidoreductase